MHYEEIDGRRYAVEWQCSCGEWQNTARPYHLHAHRDILGLPGEMTAAHCARATTRSRAEYMTSAHPTRRRYYPETREEWLCSQCGECCAIESPRHYYQEPVLFSIEEAIQLPMRAVNLIIHDRLVTDPVRRVPIK